MMMHVANSFLRLSKVLLTGPLCAVAFSYAVRMSPLLILSLKVDVSRYRGLFAFWLHYRHIEYMLRFQLYSQLPIRP